MYHVSYKRLPLFSAIASGVRIWLLYLAVKGKSTFQIEKQILNTVSEF